MCHFCRKKKFELFFKTLIFNQPWASLTRNLPRGDLHSLQELVQVQGLPGGAQQDPDKGVALPCGCWTLRARNSGSHRAVSQHSVLGMGI